MLILVRVIQIIFNNNNINVMLFCYYNIINFVVNWIGSYNLIAMNGILNKEFKAMYLHMVRNANEFSLSMA